MKYFIALFLLIGCSSRNQPEILSLEGSWVSIYPLWYKSQSYSAIKFRKNDFLKVSDAGPTLVGKFRTTGDTIYIDQDLDKSIYYTIIRHSKDSLMLWSGEDTLSFYNRNLEYNADLKLDKVVLKAGGCFGECPEFELTLQRDKGKSYFNGIKQSKVLGEYTLDYSKEEWNKIDSLFRWSRIDKMDSSFFHGLPDDWAWNVEIYYNGRQKTFKASQNGLPYRVRPVFDQILEGIRRRKLI